MAVTTIPTAGIADDAVTIAKASGFGKIAQIVQSTTSTGVNTTSSSYQDLLSLNITPSATSSKIFLMASIPFRKRDSGQADNAGGARITKAGSVLLEWGRYLAWNNNQEPYTQETGTMNYLDSPNTTSELEFKLQYRSMVGPSGSVGVCHDSSWASFTAMEVLA